MPAAYAQGLNTTRDIPSQVILRISSNLYMSLALALIFLFLYAFLFDLRCLVCFERGAGHADGMDVLGRSQAVFPMVFIDHCPIIAAVP